MVEELQHLIDRIQREAVDTGEQQAAKIVSQAKEKAAEVVRQAEANAASIIEKADREAKQFALRGEQALEQSARDLLISVGRGVEKIFDELVGRSVDNALDEKSLQDLISRVVDAYIGGQDGGKAVEVVVSEADRGRLDAYFRRAFAQELGEGVSIATDPRMTGGFKVRLQGGNVEHDFSREAIADAVSAYLRPVLAETVHRVARKQG